jgi:ribulose-phosphate 3-epimerase
VSNILIAPSIIAADFQFLNQQIKEAELSGADWFHLDVMDGHFVPNITFGPLIVETVRRCTKLPLDVHLMIQNADKYLEDFRAAGADIITVHQEACPHLHRTITKIKDLGAKSGVSLNPSTPPETLKEVLQIVDLVLLMTVNPGFGGQKFIKSMLGKIQTVESFIKDEGLSAYLQVDGGIDSQTAKLCVEAGANVLVAGTSIFRNGNIPTAIKLLRQSVNSSLQ